MAVVIAALSHGRDCELRLLLIGILIRVDSLVSVDLKMIAKNRDRKLAMGLITGMIEVPG